jgi:hypothetical protein
MAYSIVLHGDPVVVLAVFEVAFEKARGDINER